MDIPGYENYTDEELIVRYRSGEKGISDFLVGKYKDLVRKKARAMFLIGGETDDLIQEGMIGLFKAIRDYQPGKDTSFYTFASLCIDRQLYSAVQSVNRKKHMPLNYYVSLSEEEEKNTYELWADNPESIIIDQENTEALKKEISLLLSPMENKVLSSYLKGYGYIQIAEFLHKSPKSIDNALQRIRGKIRDYIAKYQENENKC